MKSKLIILLFGVAVLFSSCAKFPQTQFDSATNAIQTAKDAGADVYVPDVYQALVDSMKSASVKAEKVKSTWFFPSYTEVNTLLVATMDSAIQAKVKTDNKKSELKAEIELLIPEVKALVETNKALLSKAPKGKDGKVVLNAMDADLDVIETTLTEVESLYSNGDFLNADSKVKTLKYKALLIKSELETAIGKVKK